MTVDFAKQRIEDLLALKFLEFLFMVPVDFFVDVLVQVSSFALATPMVVNRIIDLGRIQVSGSECEAPLHLPWLRRRRGGHEEPRTQSSSATQIRMDILDKVV